MNKYISSTPHSQEGYSFLRYFAVEHLVIVNPNSRLCCSKTRLLFEIMHSKNIKNWNDKWVKGAFIRRQIKIWYILWGTVLLCGACSRNTHVLLFLTDRSCLNTVHKVIFHCQLHDKPSSQKNLIKKFWQSHFHKANTQRKLHNENSQ